MNLTQTNKSNKLSKIYTDDYKLKMLQWINNTNCVDEKKNPLVLANKCSWSDYTKVLDRINKLALI